MRQAAVNVADNGVAEIHQTLGNTALGHGVTRKGIQGNGQQCPGVHTLEHTLGDGDQGAAVKESDTAHGSQTQCNADRHAQKHKDKETAQKPSNHFSSSFLVSSTTRFTSTHRMHNTPAAGKIA